MGLAFSTLRFVLDARERGISFKNTLTLGRIQAYLLPREIEKLAKLAGRELSKAALQTEFGGFADEILKDLLDIETLEALDYSAYQGASIMHDMNTRIPLELEKKFDAVIDAGTIEHIFNFPVAIANCMKLVREGGRLFIITVANNHCGHGFYQFSPELFFRLFQNRNGFHIERIMLLEHPFPGLELSSRHRFYTVQDPDEIGTRVGLVTGSPVMLLLEAERLSVEDILAPYPYQSDYTTLWQSHQDGSGRGQGNASPHQFVNRLRKLFYGVSEHSMPRLIRKLALLFAGLYQRHVLFSLRNRKHFRRFP
jgi:SAM-dependent methyltransferase